MRKEKRSLSASVVVLACVCGAVLVGCDSGVKKTIGVNDEGLSCSPAWCDGGTCGDDGCGGTCGCQSGAVCSTSTQCVAPSACTDTCQSAGYECGTVCGASCGTCGAGQQCFWHKCYTPPVKDSCTSCAVNLSVVAQEVSADNLITKVVLAIDYTPNPTYPARMADFWLYVNNADAQLTNVVTGPGLADAGKSFFVDPVTKKSYRQRADRSFQLLALSLSNTNPIAGGTLATLEFTFKGNGTPGPVPFKLLRHPTLAPLGADNSLDSNVFESAVVVTAK